MDKQVCASLHLGVTGKGWVFVLANFPARSQYHVVLFVGLVLADLLQARVTAVLLVR